MARMIPLYSVSSQAEIERRARELFEQAGRPAGSDLDHRLPVEADYGEHLLWLSGQQEAVPRSRRLTVS